MTKEKISKLSEALFLRYPYDPPDKLFKLAKDFLDYQQKYLKGDVKPAEDTKTVEPPKPDEYYFECK